MAKRMYRVRVLVSDGAPGLIPFTWHLHADSRSDAISIVRKRTRVQSKVVKHIDFAHLASPAAR